MGRRPPRLCQNCWRSAEVPGRVLASRFGDAHWGGDFCSEDCLAAYRAKNPPSPDCPTCGTKGVMKWGETREVVLWQAAPRDA